METLIKRVREVAKEKGYNTTDPIEQYYHLITGVVKFDYGCIKQDEIQKALTLGELMFVLILLCDTLNIDFYELYKQANTFKYAIEDIDVNRLGALILSVVNKDNNGRYILCLKNRITFFIEVLISESKWIVIRWIDYPHTVENFLEYFLFEIETNRTPTPKADSYLKYMQNIGMNS